MALRLTTSSVLAAGLLLFAQPSVAVMTETKLPGDAGDHLGWAVEISWPYAIAGAPTDATMGTNAGKAVVYFFDGTSWAPQADLFPTASPAEGLFGWSVDIDGDLAVVSAPYEQTSGTGSGLVYVFRRNGTNWGLDGLLVPTDGGLDDSFGRDVAIHGTTVVVGAPNHSSFASESGAVYVYAHSGASWSFQQKLDPQIGVNGHFGHRLDVWGDWFAASNHFPGSAGLIHTYRRIGANWSAHQLFDASDVSPGDGFNSSVSMYDERLPLGANAHHHNPSAGAAYIFDRDALAGTWPENMEFLEVSVGNAPANLGMAGDLELALAAVGAPLGDGIAHDSGLVYAYRQGSDEDWYEVAAITASDGFENQSFGNSVGVSNDCIIVGASSDTEQGAFAGAVYIYCGVPPLAFLTDFTIICCVQIPDFTTGPVEFDFGFENITSAPKTIRRWVDLIRPDDLIVPVVDPEDVEVEEGTTYSERFVTQIGSSDPPGDYGLVLYWFDGENTHTETVGFSVAAAMPVLPPAAALLLAAGLLFLVVTAASRYGRSRPWRRRSPCGG